MTSAVSNSDFGRLLAAKLKGDSVDTTQLLNGQRWLKVGSAQYFVLKTFNASDSDKITAGLQAPSAFMFTGLGNISCNNFTFKNPIDPNRTTDYGQTSVAALAASTNQYVFDSNTVIAPNLMYILRKQASTWYLLFNALHSAHFKAYYANVIPNAMLTWGATPVDTDASMNLQRVFQNHCNALQTTNADSTKSYVDPACNLIYSDAQCRSSSFFVNNVVQQPPDKMSRYASALQGLGAGAPPNCLCVGAPHDYVVANVDKNKSFIFDFQKLSTCNPSLQMNICDMITQGGTNNIKDSQFNMHCGGSTDPAPSTTTQGTNVKDDGAAAAAAAQLAAQQALQAKNDAVAQQVAQALTSSSSRTLGTTAAAAGAGTSSPLSTPTTSTAYPTTSSTAAAAGGKSVDGSVNKVAIGGGAAIVLVAVIAFFAFRPTAPQQRSGAAPRRI